MAVIEGRTWLEVLSPPECWRLLCSAGVGRVAVAGAGGPEIFPVNFAVDGEAVVFRTARGTKLAAIDDAPSVAFEADGFDFDDRTGWSVVVKGRATVVGAPGERARLDALPITLWAPCAKDTLVRIAAREVTGRRIRH
jgi:nitroimidazol reductase NimA-like FMN-containing flavoprotein (pyridoxamine 5'-phosphate oxidase superfamily)